jgi:hypothetical protein
MGRGRGRGRGSDEPYPGCQSRLAAQQRRICALIGLAEGLPEPTRQKWRRDTASRQLCWTGARDKSALTAELDFVLGHCLRGYFMMLFGQRAMVSCAQRSLEAAQGAARATGIELKTIPKIADSAMSSVPSPNLMIDVKRADGPKLARLRRLSPTHCPASIGPSCDG